MRTWDRGSLAEFVEAIAASGVWCVLLDHSGSAGGIGGPRTIDLTGQTTVTRAAAICAWSNCVVGPDSGLIHIGGALGRPIVGLFTTWTPDLRVSQYHGIAISPASELECSPCHDRGCAAVWCALWTSPQEVLRAVHDIIGRHFGLDAPDGDEVDTRNFARYGDPCSRVLQEVTHEKGADLGADSVPLVLMG